MEGWRDRGRYRRGRYRDRGRDGGRYRDIEGDIEIGGEIEGYRER